MVLNTIHTKNSSHLQDSRMKLQISGYYTDGQVDDAGFCFGHRNRASFLSSFLLTFPVVVIGNGLFHKIKPLGILNL